MIGENLISQVRLTRQLKTEKSDLLKALEDLISLCDDAMPSEQCSSNELRRIAAARDAIAKAKRKTPERRTSPPA